MLPSKNLNCTKFMKILNILKTLYLKKKKRHCILTLHSLKHGTRILNLAVLKSKNLLKGAVLEKYLILILLRKE